MTLRSQSLPWRASRVLARTAAILLTGVSALASVAGRSADTSRQNLPEPWPTAFLGVLNPTPAESRMDYPRLPAAPAGAPNILLVMTDDVGFGAASTFGGPIPTPNLDRLAAQGLVYNRFHTTAMCSPSRAALLTGRNHHSVGTGALTDFADGYPGYNSFLPKSAATIGEVLRDNGYATAWFGKDHNIPVGQLSAAGPFTQWPTSIGFDYFFGFVGAETDQWQPQLFRGTSRLSDQPVAETLDKRLADDALDWIHNVKAAAPDKPFFIYYAPGSAHTPHQAPADWIARFKGAFDKGWDAVRNETLARQQRMGLVPGDAMLAPRAQAVPEWSSLSADEKRVQARLMEVNAGMLAYQDAQFGRILDELGRMGVADNTLIVFVEGDNGADAAAGMNGELTEMGEMANRKSSVLAKLRHLDEFGSPTMETNYSAGWAMAMNTPFPWFKQIASHLGGTRNGLVVSWPAGIKSHGVRTQYHHLIDIMPTLLEAAKVPAPQTVDGVEQQPIDGVSMSYSFEHPEAAGRHQVQYYEMLGNRAIYDHGWLASTVPQKTPWDTTLFVNDDLAANYHWQLFDLQTDFTQSHDLSTKWPDKLKAMQALFDNQARRYNVYPLDDRESARMNGLAKVYVPRRDSYVYWGKNLSLSTDVAPPLTNHSFAIEAQVRAASDVTGVIVAVGSRFGGWSFYLKNGQPRIALNFAGLREDEVTLAASASIVADAPTTIRFAFDYDGGGFGKGGWMTISIAGRQIARRHLDRTIIAPGPIGETFDIGLDRGVSVTDDYLGNGAFPGAIDKVTVTVGPASQAAPMGENRLP